MSLLAIAKGALASAGIEIRRTPRGYGVDPYRDMRSLLGTDSPIVFDVGANVGQSVARFRKAFGCPEIHSFEPCEATFCQLVRATKGVPNLRLNNTALGSESECRDLLVNEHSDLSSFLEPGTTPGVGLWAPTKCKELVQVETLDGYCHTHAVERIDVLKTDTQGFDLEVLKGAKGLLARKAVRLIYMEMTFCELYKGLPRPDEVFAFLLDHGFVLSSFYSWYCQDGTARWADALFVLDTQAVA